jgi:TolA-binding protein
MNHQRYMGWKSIGMAAAVAALWLARPARAQVTNDQAAAMVLNSARKAYNEKNYPFAAARFKEFLDKHGGHKDAPSARYGMALALLAGPQVNYQQVRDVLQPVAGNKNLPEHPLIVYHLGLAIRGQGIQELNQADAKPQEANQRRDAARQRFEEAGQQFAQALAAFVAKSGAALPDAKTLPENVEWAARARCDHAEMYLRTSKLKEAQADTLPFLQDAVLARSKYRDLGRYYHGFASFLLGDRAAAEKTLSMLAPFSDLGFGTHARYLLARAHHLADEHAEARVHYDAVLADYAKIKKNAPELLRQPKYQNDPVEKSRLEAIQRNPPPDHVARSTFYLGVLRYEAGQFGEARGHFADFVKQFPKSPLTGEAELRLGFCHVQLREYPDAMRVLTPLPGRDQRLADQALLWLAKAQVGMAPDPQTNWQGYQSVLNAALGTFRQAADRAQQQSGMDPDARQRRGEILLELADTQQLLKQPREAANTYNQLLNEKDLPQRMEEIHERLITALHLANDYNESDRLCRQFQEKYPQSTLLPAVLFRFAENSYFRVVAADKNTNPKDLAKLQDDSILRYEAILQKYPEAPQINLARYSLGLTYYRKGDLEKARITLNAVPAQDRNGDLATVPYVIADCVLRLAPKTVPEDALEAGKLEEQLKTAAELLDGFVGSQPKSPQAPDALLKLGLCEQRRATVLGQPPERAKAFAAARTTYDRLINQYPKDALVPQAVLERAKCQAQMGDPNGAMNELRRFTNDPLKNTPAAPMALVELATLLRAQNKASEAAGILAKAREQHEPALTREPQRADELVVLRYHHGVALREAGKLADARSVFDQVMKQAAGRPEAADAALRFGQCLADEARQKIDAAQKLRIGSKKPEDIAAAKRNIDEGYKGIAAAVQFLETQAEQLRQKQPALEARARMHYEIAWGYRAMADHEIQRIREQKVQEILKKGKSDAAALSPPEIPLKAIPLQPAEKRAHGHYHALVDSFPELPLSSEARFELAEMLAQRQEYDDALKLLNEGLDKEPPAELTEKIRIHLGIVHAARGDLKAALGQFNAVALNAKSALAGHAQYRAGEVLMHNKQYDEAVKRFIAFRDQPQFQNVPGVSDRALFRLGQAYARLKNWEESRRAHERLAGAFPNSPWADEARYGMGWAVQQQKQYDQAVNLYSQVTARTVSVTAAKAQLQIGLCRLEQKRYEEAANALLVVPYTYDYPELSAAAMLEAARALSALKQNDQAGRILERLIRDFPATQWANAARERLRDLRPTEQTKND